MPSSGRGEKGKTMTSEDTPDIYQEQVEFCALLADIRKSAYGYAYQLTKNQTDTEDLFQEAT